MSTLAERWASLRDREAVGDPLSPGEVSDLSSIEGSDPEVQAYVVHMRELERYLEGKQGEHATAPDHHLVLRALSAVQLDAPSPRVRAIDHDRELARAADPEGPSWIRILATAVSVTMMVAAALALVAYEPRSLRRATGAAPTVTAEEERALVIPLAPKVESLLRVRTAERGARLRRDGDALGPQSQLGLGDRLESGERPGCLVMEDELEVCLGPASMLRLKALSENNLVLLLESGRLTWHGPRGTKRRARLEAGGLQASFDGPTTFGLEMTTGEHEVVRARVLRGLVRITAEDQTREVRDLKSAVYRRSEHQLEVVELAPGPAQHEWDLVATGSRGSVIAPIWSAGAEKPKGAMSSGSERSPGELMQDAWELLKAERWQEAAEVYERIARDAPGSDESHIVSVRLGALLLERLASPERALHAFDRYLNEGGGPLAAEARHGRITVYRRLGRAIDERDAIEEFLRFHASSAETPQMEARLRVLAP